MIWHVFGELIVVQELPASEPTGPTVGNNPTDPSMPSTSGTQPKASDHYVLGPQFKPLPFSSSFQDLFEDDLDEHDLSDWGYHINK